MRKNKRVVSILLVIIFLSLNLNVNGVKAKDNDKATGYVTSKEEQSFQREGNENSLIKFYNEEEDLKLPSIYNALDYDEITGVRDQGHIGCCWAFAAYGAIEAYLKKNTGEDYDFSEMHMAASKSIENINKGGSFHDSFTYFIKGKGPVLEKENPYPSSGQASDAYLNKDAKVDYRINNMEYLYNKKPEKSVEYIKKNLLKYGAIACSIRIADCDYLTHDKKYLYNPDKDVLSDHGVTIIGWDDTISKNHFTHMPDGDGAFICKNSWGEDQSFDGYFYVSYYDTQIGSGLAVYDDIEKISPNEKTINYSDFTGSKSEYASFTEYKYYGTVFEADEDINLNSISIISDYVGVNYKVYVEEDFKDDFRNILNKESGQGSFENSGAHNIKLNSPIKIKKGKRYFVCIQSNEAIANSYNGDSEGINNSYVKKRGVWQKASGCFPITVHTSKVLENEVKSIELDKPSISLNGGESLGLNISFNPSNTTDKTINWKTSDSSVASVNEQGVVKAKRNGQAVITAYTELGNAKASCIVNVTNAFNVSAIHGYKEGEVLNKWKDLNIVFNDFINEGKEKPYFMDEDENKYECSYNLKDNNIDIHIDSSKDYVGSELKLIIPRGSFVNNSGQELGSEKVFKFKAPYKYVDNIEFKDKNFEKIIRTKLGRNTGDISSNDMLQINELYIDDGNIWSLSGLEYAVNLKYVTIYKSNIYSLDVMKNLNALEQVTIEYSNISSLEPLRNKNNLSLLDIENTRLNDYSAIATLKNLKTLNLPNTFIDNIEFIEGINNLENLYLNDNQIKDISVVKNLTKLSSVHLKNNQIKDISPLYEACCKYDGNEEFRAIDIDKNLVGNSKDTEGDNIINKIRDLNIYVYIANPKENMNVKFVNGDVYDNAKNDDMRGNINDLIEIEFSMDITNNIEENSVYIYDEKKEKDIYFDTIINKNILYLKPKEEVSDLDNYLIYFNEGSINGLPETIIEIKPYDSSRGDINKDGKVDLNDLIIAANDYNKQLKTASSWNIDEDCVKDGIIDIYDMCVISKEIN